MSAKEAVEESLQLEKGALSYLRRRAGNIARVVFTVHVRDPSPDVNSALLKLHQIADEANDPQLCDYVESEFLSEQVRSIKQLADMCTQLARVGDGLGVYLWDQQMRSGGTGAGAGDIHA